MYPVYLGEPLIFFFFLSKYLCKYKRGHLIRLLISKYFSINFNVSILFQTCHPLYVHLYVHIFCQKFLTKSSRFQPATCEIQSRRIVWWCWRLGYGKFGLQSIIHHTIALQHVSRCLSILRTNINVNRSDIIIIFKRIFEYLFALQRGGMCISYTSDTLWLISGLFV